MTTRPPWSVAGLGHDVTGLMTAEEAIVKAKLDWEVKVTQLRGDKGKVLPGNFYVHREDDDELWVTVKTVYQPLQNRRAFSFFDPIIGEGTMAYSTAGYFRGGRTVWMLVDLNRTWEPVKGDPVRDYLLLTHAHDGVAAIRLGHTPIRVACENTLALAISSMIGRGGSGLNIAVRHTASAEAKIELGIGQLQKSLELSQKLWEAQVATLVTQKWSEAEIHDFATDIAQANRVIKMGVAPKLNREDLADRQKPIAEEIFGLALHGLGTDIPGVLGTGWGLYNAVTEWVDHHSHGKDRNANMQYSMFDGGSTLKMHALELASRRVNWR